MIKKPNKQNHHPKQPKSNVPTFQNKGNQFRVGQWKQPYPPEDHGKTTSMPVIGDHSILQNIKLFHCKSMETMSQGPRAVTLSQRRPISVWCWWPAMSRRITPPLAEREIKVRRELFSWRHTHRSSESQHSFQAMLIYHRLKQRMCFFPIKKWKGLVMGQSEGSVSKLFWGQDFTPAPMWGWEGGGSHKAHCLVEPEHKKGSNEQKLKGMDAQRKNWSSYSRLHWGSRSCLSGLVGGTDGMHDLD